MEMLLEAREKIERLEAIDAEGLEEIVRGIQLRARDLEMVGGELEDFVGGFIESGHGGPKDILAK